MKTNLILLFLLSVAAAPQPLGAQTARPARPVPAKPRPAPATPAQPKVVPPKPQGGGVQGPASTPVNPNTYKIGLNDEVKVTVFDEPDLTAMYRVDADGSISFPLIGRVDAVGSTLFELQQRITKMLSSGYIKNPQVRAEINQYKSQFVYVIGEVRAPGKITMTGATMTLLEALALAGSPTANASNEVIVVHPNHPDVATGTPSTDIDGARVTVNRKDLELGKVGQDVMLQDGDIINVPSAQHFYITGMVRNPGTWVLDPSMTIQQAIAVAGGLNERGSDRRIKVSRVVNGKLTEVGVNLEDKIQAGDTITISGRFF